MEIPKIAQRAPRVLGVSLALMGVVDLLPNAVLSKFDKAPIVAKLSGPAGMLATASACELLPDGTINCDDDPSQQAGPVVSNPTPSPETTVTPAPTVSPEASPEPSNDGDDAGDTTPAKPHHPKHKSKPKGTRKKSKFSDQGIVQRVRTNQEKWNARISESGCGDVVATVAWDDFTGQAKTPTWMEGQLTPDYYVPGSGTYLEAFTEFLPKAIHLHAQVLGGEKGVERVMKKDGLVVMEFNADLARARSGHSEIAVVDHYTVIDAYRDHNGKIQFAMVDPHEGKNRHNTTKENGDTRWWTYDELYGQGLTNKVGLTRTSKTPVKPRFRD